MTGSMVAPRCSPPVSPVRTIPTPTFSRPSVSSPPRPSPPSGRARATPCAASDGGCSCPRRPRRRTSPADMAVSSPGRAKNTASTATRTGTLFAVDIRCPHRGCELTWNDDEKSWDCPCHGSRFDYTGRRLSEPGQGRAQALQGLPAGDMKKRAVRLAFLPVFSYSAACQCLSVGRSLAR